ncbi:hypothetical protein A5744_03245 [Mycobacterium sp. IS-1264]|nr:hypothetical protein A5744_03245 [Mycobacterium sp. IS-1264]
MAAGDGGRASVAHTNKYVAAAAGVAIAGPFIASVVLGAPGAHADLGMGGDGFLRCIDSAGVPPKQNADDWTPTINVIEFNLNGALSPTEVAQRLTAMGVKPHDATAEVQCVMTNLW